MGDDTGAGRPGSIALVTKKTTGSLNLLQAAAGLMTLGALAQTILGFVMYSGNHSMATAHTSIGGGVVVLAIVAAVASVLWCRQSGNKGLRNHGIGMAVLALAQFALGELAYRGLTMVHIVVGLAFLIGAAGLATLAVRKPGSATT